MRWAEVLENKSLRDLPFKIETNRHGQVVLSPISPSHGRYQGMIIGILYSMKTSGNLYSECPIQTPEGVKVPDVAWASNARSALNCHELTFLVAPELCVEVPSPSNRAEEIDEKRQLYFQLGAQEVWICGEDGQIRFFESDDELLNSRLFPAFPKQI